MVQKTILTAILFLCFTNIFAQKTEISAAFNSGLFSFSGSGAEKTSFMSVYSGRENSGYTNDPHGSKAALCYGISGKAQRISKRKMILGAELGYEVLRSKVAINKVFEIPFDIGFTIMHNATGQTYLNNQFINLNLFGGYRFGLKKISIDVTGGFDISNCLKAMEKGKATADNGKVFTSSQDRKTIDIDFRPRLQVAASYKKAGIYAGYSFGLANYKTGYIGGTDNEVYSRVFRFGLTYRLK